MAAGDGTFSGSQTDPHRQPAARRRRARRRRRRRHRRRRGDLRRQPDGAHAEQRHRHLRRADVLRPGMRRAVGARPGRHERRRHLRPGGRLLHERARWRSILGNGNGTFTALPAQDAGGGPWQVALGDVDGDGDIDVASGEQLQCQRRPQPERRHGRARPADHGAHGRPHAGERPRRPRRRRRPRLDPVQLRRRGVAHLRERRRGQLHVRPGHPRTVEPLVCGARRLRQRRRHRPGAQRRAGRRRAC